jgi:hypothetical protein
MSEQRVLFLRKGFIGTCAFAALLLLASFYSIVSGAVERAARQRLASTGDVTPATVLGAMQRQQPRANTLFARVGN